MNRPRLLLLLLLVATPLRADLLCTVGGVSDLDFGAVSPLETLPTDVSASLTLTCQAERRDIQGPTGNTRDVTLCLSYDNGSAGASPGGNRQLLAGTEAAIYDLYTDTAYGPEHWGSRTGVPTGVVRQAGLSLVKPPPQVDNTDPVSVIVPVFARLFPNQNTLSPALYSSVLGLTVEAFWGSGPRAKTDCLPGDVPEQTLLESQPVRVDYQKECRVASVGALDFGSSGLLTQALDASTSVSVACTVSTPFSIGLGPGSGASVTDRRLTRQGSPAAQVSYGLYRDAARSQNWGNDTLGGSDTVNGTGSGSAMTFPIHGRVPSQDTPEPGEYRDLVTLTVVF
ncbi:MAG TPA: spore coat protein U domain-containing protein [Nevskiaceae bacterium]|nr:spore coat protein U domain-containing protein [Nevskiaceae bacterium]